jgi:HEAT repeat protein
MTLFLASLVLLPSGCNREKPIAILIQELQSNDPSDRYHALKELEKRGPEAKAAVPALVETLHDSTRDNRYRAVKALSKIGADSTAVPGLASALRDPDPEIRYYAAKSLAEIGDPAESAVPAIVEALKDKGNGKAYHYLIKSLRKLGPKAQAAVPTLRELAHHSDDNIRKDAAAALKSIGAK